MNKKIGIYVHVPFCRKKCNYCDFYSIEFSQSKAGQYIQDIALCMEKYRGAGLIADTLYIGGGTPSLLGDDGLSMLCEKAGGIFAFSQNAEITVEVNPEGVDEKFFKGLKNAGVNRVSMGMQSVHDSELEILGRIHGRREVEMAVKAAQKSGINNISLDIMLALPYSCKEKIRASIDFAVSLGIYHISCYILKIEEGTPFGNMKLCLPCEDEASEQYLFAVNRLSDLGFEQYEISNFARAGYESRHNLKYWRCEEYLGFGPSAHSFFKGRRFFYPGKLGLEEPVYDGEGGTPEEYVMLALRLKDGLIKKDFDDKFGNGEYEKILKNAKKYPPHLIEADDKSISLTAEGFLISNYLTSRLL